MSAKLRELAKITSGPKVLKIAKAGWRVARIICK